MGLLNTFEHVLAGFAGMAEKFVGGILRRIIQSVTGFGEVKDSRAVVTDSESRLVPVGRALKLLVQGRCEKSLIISLRQTHENWMCIYNEIQLNTYSAVPLAQEHCSQVVVSVLWDKGWVVVLNHPPNAQ